MTKTFNQLIKEITITGPIEPKPHIPWEDPFHPKPKPRNPNLPWQDRDEFWDFPRPKPKPKPEPKPRFPWQDPDRPILHFPLPNPDQPWRYTNRGRKISNNLEELYDPDGEIRMSSYDSEYNKLCKEYHHERNYHDNSQHEEQVNGIVKRAQDLNKLENIEHEDTKTHHVTKIYLKGEVLPHEIRTAKIFKPPFDFNKEWKRRSKMLDREWSSPKYMVSEEEEEKEEKEKPRRRPIFGPNTRREPLSPEEAERREEERRERHGNPFGVRKRRGTPRKKK